MITARRTPPKNWTWLYIVSFILLGVMTYDFERQIEFNQMTTLPIDYN